MQAIVNVTSFFFFIISIVEVASIRPASKALGQLRSIVDLCLKATLKLAETPIFNNVAFIQGPGEAEDWQSQLRDQVKGGNHSQFD